MAFSILVYTPENVCDPTLAIAAARGGEAGLLNLGPGRPEAEVRSALARLARQTGPGTRWGVRWNAWTSIDARPPAVLERLERGARVPIMVVAGLDSESDEGLALRLEWARERAEQVVFEALDLATGRRAAAIGFDGLVIVANEAGGRVGRSSAFLAMQALGDGIGRPVWIRAAWGPDTAAIAGLVEDAGVVLCEELWLAREAPANEHDRARLACLDGTETICLDDGTTAVRLFGQAGRETLTRLETKIARGEPWTPELLARLRETDNPGESPLPMGQGVAFAAGLAERYGTVGRMLDAYRKAADRNVSLAAERGALAPGGPLAEAHGVRYPIFQGPMTRVSDCAPFIRAVADGGALPFLALALMRKEEARKVLLETRSRLGERPWGVGILGFVPPELRKEQLEAIQQVRPRLAIVAGGRPAQAAALEADGISTYLHVPSPDLLRSFLDDGARKFIFEGRECGGHVGPRSSLSLWQASIDTLRDAGLRDPENVQVLFAGGVHDARSAAMVETLAAPLTELGVKIGVLMGTSYLFTAEAVETGAITANYQREAIGCRETVLLESGVGHATRCARTPFAEEFFARKREMQAAGLEPADVRLRLELLNVGRLRVASKGLTRRARSERDALDPGSTAELVEVDTETQRDEGMYMIGALAALRDGTLTMAELHEEVSAGSARRLQALGAARDLRARSGARRVASEPIAIVGMACLFPGAADLATYWKNILCGVDAVGEVPSERWKPEQFYDEDRRAPDRLYSTRGAFLDSIRFDPLRYMIPPAALSSVEPAQLLSLEVTRRALADAGYENRPFDRDRTSVIIGCGSIHDMGINYVQRTLIPQLIEGVSDLDETEQARIVDSIRDRLAPWTEDSFPGVLPNVIAGRIANRLDLRGANFIVDAACSSSLAALHTAVEQLRSGTSDVVLAGAVDCSNNAFTFMGFAQTHALTPRDRPRPFDASADGIVLGEGVATVVLKRLVDAERDGDSIYAVIRGVGCSSDGRHTSLTAPYPEAQALALRRAYEDAGADPTTVGLIEAHATGTAVGDRAEIESLTAVLGGDGRTERCAIGSVKSMIGHTKTTAGMAGLLKAALALKHRVLPPTIHVDTPNPALEANDVLYVNTETRPWIGSPADHPRRAGVSAFGFGGTNFHVVLEEYRGGFHQGFALQHAPRAAELFTWTRENRADLARDLAALRDEVGALADLRIDRLAAAAHAEEKRRSRGAVRCAVLAASVDDLAAKLDKAVSMLAEKGNGEDRGGIYLSDAPPVDPATVCFLFPGQGSQYPGMLEELAQDAPFGTWMFEEADAMLSDLVPGRLSQRIFPEPVFGRKAERAQQRALTDTRIAQPALCVVELFLLDVLGRFGLRPAFAAGHSFGECVALAAAGCFTRPGLLRLSAWRGLVLHDVALRHPGGMAAVAADERTTADALAKLAIPALIANTNGPRQTIIAGPPETLEAAIKGLTDEGLAVRRVAVSAPFHTPAMDEASESLRENLAATPMWVPQIPVYSNVTAAPYPNDLSGMRELLTLNMTRCVRFVDQIRAMHRDGARVFVEVGPGRILTGLVTRILEGQSHTAASVDQSGQSAWLSLGHLLARTHALGLEIDLDSWFAGRDLGRASRSELVARERLEAEGRPTDWWVGPVGARAVHAAAPPEPKPRRARKPLAQPKEKTEIESMNNETRDRLVALHRETMSQWLDLQREQVRLNERFLRLQERLVAAELGLPQEPLPATDGDAGRTTGATAPDLSPPGLRVAPAPVLPRLEPTVGAASAEPAPAARGPVVPAGETPAPAVAEDPADGPPSVDAFYRDLLAEVSRRTGYPEEMLDPDLPLEAGLGIDSIKVMEIFSALKPYHHVLADADEDNEDVLAQFVELKTLGAIRRHYDRRRSAIAEGPTNGEAVESAPTERPPVDVPSARVRDESPRQASVPDAPAHEETAEVRVDRLVVRSVPTAPLGEVRIDADALRFPKDQVLLLVGDVPEFGPGLRAALGRGGYLAVQVVPGAEMRPAGSRRYEANFDDPVSLIALAAAIREECAAPVGGIINFLGLGDRFRELDLEAVDAPLQLATWLLNLSKTFEPDILASVESGGGLLVNLTSLDGHFGLSDSRPLPVAQAASLGFFKALGKEWRHVRVKNIDVDSDASPELLLTAMVAELANWDDEIEIGIHAGGRSSIGLIDEAPHERDAARTLEAWTQKLALGPESVVLATGGARGITAEVLRALAAETAGRLVIVGRSPLTTREDEPAELRDLPDGAALRRALIESRKNDPDATPARIEREVDRILRDRAIRRNLALLEASGSRVEYHAMDVRDSAALSALVADVYQRFGRIDGVIHAAGVVEDRRVRDKTPESFARVFQTKVRPAMVLARILRPESLRFLAFFSSVSGRFGNAGQVDYSAANECLNKIAAHLDREWPARVVAMNWGPWDCGLITESLREAYRRRGIKLIPPAAGSRAFVEELGRREDRSPEVVLACNAREMARAGDESPER